jgi:hypothetical protein
MDAFDTLNPQTQMREKASINGVMLKMDQLLKIFQGLVQGLEVAAQLASSMVLDLEMLKQGEEK